MKINADLKDQVQDGTDMQNEVKRLKAALLASQKTVKDLDETVSLLRPENELLQSQVDELKEELILFRVRTWEDVDSRGLDFVFRTPGCRL